VSKNEFNIRNDCAAVWRKNQLVNRPMEFWRSTGFEKTNSFETKLCRISAALRQGSNGDNDFVGFLVVRNEHHRRDASLFSIAVQFPKLDVAGSIPVSRSIY